MDAITAKVQGLEDVRGYYTALATNQLPYAMMNTLNDLAFEGRRNYIDDITRTFDRPKPQTAKNVFVRKATKTNLRAVIFFDQIYDKGIDEYMLANIVGGERKMKPSEKRLGKYFVPGMGAKMDKYGNMQGGQITQILSQLGRFGDVAGYSMNQTTGSRKRRGRASKSTEYFMVTKKTGGLVPGIYQRIAGGVGPFQPGQSPWLKSSRGLGAGSFQKGKSSAVIRGRGVMPIVIFTKAPRYKAIWPFYKSGQGLVDAKFKPTLGKYIDHALRTAR